MIKRKEVWAHVKADVWSIDKKGNRILLKNVPAERNRKRKITRVDINEVIRRTNAFERAKKCRVRGHTDDLELTDNELRWLEWALKEIIGHPYWQKRYRTLEAIREKVRILREGKKEASPTRCSSMPNEREVK